MYVVIPCIAHETMEGVYTKGRDTMELQPTATQTLCQSVVLRGPHSSGCDEKSCLDRYTTKVGGGGNMVLKLTDARLRAAQASSAECTVINPLSISPLTQL